EARAGRDFVGVVDDVADHREQVLGHAADDFAVDEGHGGGVAQFDLDAAVLLLHLDLEIGEALRGLARVVGLAAAGQYRQGAAAQQLMQAVLAGVAQTGHLGPRKDVQAAARGDACADGGGSAMGVAHLLSYSLVFFLVAPTLAPARPGQKRAGPEKETAGGCPPAVLSQLLAATVRTGSGSRSAPPSGKCRGRR